MAKRIDCFSFATGHEVLKIRLAELADHIDWFVLVESTHDFAGNPKPLRWKENPITGYKVKHVVVEPLWVAGQLPIPDWLAWNNMNHQVEEGFRIGLEDADASDIGYFSDFDEIMRPSKLMIEPLDRPIVYKMDWYMYWLNNKVGHQQEGTCRMGLGDIGSNGSYFSALTARYAPDRYLIENGGWHLSSFGGPEVIKQKFDGYMDIDMRQLTLEQIEAAILSGQDLEPRVQRSTRLIELEDTLPETVVKNIKDWEHLIHPDFRNKTLSVVIPAWSATPELEAMTVKLAKQVKPMCDELIITEDGIPSKKLLQIADTYLTHNRLGHALNLRLGIETATKEYIAILDTDVEIKSGNLRELCVPNNFVYPDWLDRQQYNPPQTDQALLSWFMVAPRKFLQEYLPYAAPGPEGLDQWGREVGDKFPFIRSNKVSYNHAGHASYGIAKISS